MWDEECGLPCIVFSFEGLQTSAVPRPAPGSRVVLFARAVWFGFDYASPASLVPCRSTFGLGSKARRTLDLDRRMTSLLIAEGWATLCRIALVERSLTRFPPPWRSERRSVTLVHPCREDQYIRIAMSTVN